MKHYKCVLIINERLLIVKVVTLIIPDCTRKISIQVDHIEFKLKSLIKGILLIN